MSDTTSKEHTMTNGQKIQAWRDTHPEVRLTARTLMDVLDLTTLCWANLSGADLSGANLGGADLRGADLSGADLSGAYLRWAYLRGADLYRADLRDADLRGANLGGANLSGADLSGANLRGANLRGVRHGHILTMAGLPSGDAALYPTCDGWYLQVGCWGGTIDGLAALIAGDEGWPEATGDECAERRPGLEALIIQARAHVARYPDVITEHQKAHAEKEAK